MTIQFDKSGLAPAIVQDAVTGQVLMLGYMNKEAVRLTLETRLVTFYSRSRQELWKKGETSGNTLALVEMKADCDGDTLLVKAVPAGPTCHKGTQNCWGESAQVGGVLGRIEEVISDRFENPSDSSYVSSLFLKGLNKIAQKVGEEAVEVVIEAKDDDEKLFLNESADLLFHLLVLLKAKNVGLEQVLQVLQSRQSSG